jgi:hypothetical protein
LTSCNLNKLYCDFIPIFINSWNKLVPEAKVKIVLIANDIPEEFKVYSENIILFNPIEGVSSAFTSQYIRLLFPALLNSGNGVLITDMDMIPMNRKYYVNSIKHIPNDKFVYYRDWTDPHHREIAMCYNIATSTTWSDIFKIKNTYDIISRITDIYKTINYSDTHGGNGWNVDQLSLYSNVSKNPNFINLTDSACGFSRYDRVSFRLDDDILQNIKNGLYSDYHALRPYNDYKKVNDVIVDAIKPTHPLIILIIASPGDVYSKFRTVWEKYMEANPLIRCFFIYNKDQGADVSDKRNIVSDIESGNMIPGCLIKSLYAFDFCLKNFNFDYILRTNLSSFYRFDKLLEYVDTIPCTKCLSAVIGHDGGPFLSGAGMIISKDMISDIVQNRHKIDSSIIDDLAISVYLRDNNSFIPCQRCDLTNNETPSVVDTINTDKFHFRIKTSNRINDPMIMDKLYYKYYK